MDGWIEVRSIVEIARNVVKEIKTMRWRWRWLLCVMTYLMRQVTKGDEGEKGKAFWGVRDTYSIIKERRRILACTVCKCACVGELCTAV